MRDTVLLIKVVNSRWYLVYFEVDFVRNRKNAVMLAVSHAGETQSHVQGGAGYTEGRVPYVLSYYTSAVTAVVGGQHVEVRAACPQRTACFSYTSKYILWLFLV